VSNTSCIENVSSNWHLYLQTERKLLTSLIGALGFVIDKVSSSCQMGFTDLFFTLVLSFCNTIETRNDVRNREQCTHTQSWRDYADKRKKEQRIGIVPACRGEGQHMDHCLLRRGMRG
jgi:hypothetical protein